MNDQNIDMAALANKFGEGGINPADLAEIIRALASDRAVRVHVGTIAAGTDFEIPAWKNPLTTKVEVKEICILEAGGVVSDGTDYNTLTVVNKGLAGSGSTVIGTHLSNGSAITAFVPKLATLATAAADRIVGAGSVLTVKKTHGGSGKAMTQLVVIVKYSPILKKGLNNKRISR